MGKMRVVFLYTNQGAGDIVWNPKAESKNHFLGVHGLETEGYFYMLLKLKEIGAIDDFIVFIESARHPGTKTISGIKCYVVPMIRHVEGFLQEDDVIFVRGGFRGWYDPFLLNMEAQKRWLILYAANTGRQRWALWDIILTDLHTNFSCDKRGRFWFLFQKPINPNIFHKTEVERDIDVCIGASKIHDKKAQWKVINALIEYKKIFGKNLKCILPGSLRYRGKETPQIIPKINKYGLNVEQPGFVTRYELNKIYNRSKLFVYLGNSGENDRGPLEATSVGCPTLLGGTSRHAPCMGSCELGICVSKKPDDPKTVAYEIELMMNIHSEDLRNHVASYFDKHNGFDSVVIPNMVRLFTIIRHNPIPNAEVLKKEYL
jgi:hypothetical protein